MNLPDLFINVHPLPSLHFLALLQLPVIVQGGPLSPCGLFFTDDRLSGDAVKDVTTLRCKPLEIGRDVAGGEIGG